MSDRAPAAAAVAMACYGALRRLMATPCDARKGKPAEAGGGGVGAAGKRHRAGAREVRSSSLVRSTLIGICDWQRKAIFYTFVTRPF